eukprot:7437701-Pyramimonas_sp.AAC.1
MHMRPDRGSRKKATATVGAKDGPATLDRGGDAEHPRSRRESDAGGGGPCRRGLPLITPPRRAHGGG